MSDCHDEKATEIMMRKRFSANLQRRMKAMHISHNELGLKVRLQGSEIYRYTAGQIFPRIERYARLCDALEVDPSYLIRKGHEK